MPVLLTRRTLLAAGAAVAAAGPALAEAGAARLPQRDLSFSVWRKGSEIGRHHVSFHDDGTDVSVTIAAEMLVKLGPIPVFRYRHEASETWRAGRFADLRSQTVSNGRRETVAARVEGQGVAITRTDGADVMAPADAHPLTHWDAAVLEGPLFNPQTGAVVHEHVSRSTEPLRLADGRSVAATRYALSGDAEIIDWYDASGAWLALRGKAPDGSYIDYRREA